MITFKQQITVSEELAHGLALDLKYQPTLTRQIEIVDDAEATPPLTHFEIEEYENPESAVQYVERLAKEHTAKFFLPFGEKLVAQAIADAQAQVEQAREQAKAQIIDPIVDALVTEVITE